MKVIKSLIAPVITAVVVAILLNSFVFTIVRVEAAALSDYPKSSTHIVNKFTKTFEVGDVVLTKHNDVHIIRRINEIKDNKVTLVDDEGNSIVINYSDIEGKL